MNRRFALAAFTLALAGCPQPDPNAGLVTTPPDQFLDYNAFVCTAMPVLIRRCSYLACHGNPDHALRIYSPGKLRLGESVTRMERDATLTADEVERNFESASGIVYNTNQTDRQTPTQHVLLLEKPVKQSAGGAEHHGVGIFPVYPATQLIGPAPSGDLEWQALAAWVAGAKIPANNLPSDCNNIFMNLGLTPK